MKVKELINQLLDEDMDDDIAIQTLEARYTMVDRILASHEQGSLPGLVILVTDEPVTQAKE